MDQQSFQENWHSLCRKFSLVCVLDLSETSLEDTRHVVKSHCVQFDHVIAVTKNITQDDIKNYCQSERIINLTCLRQDDIPGDTIEDKIKNVTRGQAIIVFSKAKKLDTNVRWVIYDKLKEMKSPFTDIIALNYDLKYCCAEDAMFIIKLVLS